LRVTSKHSQLLSWHLFICTSKQKFG